MQIASKIFFSSVIEIVYVRRNIMWYKPASEKRKIWLCLSENRTPLNITLNRVNLRSQPRCRYILGETGSILLMNGLFSLHLISCNEWICCVGHKTRKQQRKIHSICCVCVCKLYDVKCAFVRMHNFNKLVIMYYFT